MSGGASNNNVGSGDDDGVEAAVDGIGKSLSAELVPNFSSSRKSEKETYGCAVEGDLGTRLKLGEIDSTVGGRSNVRERDIGACLDGVRNVVVLGDNAAGLKWARNGSVRLPGLGAHQMGRGSHRADLRRCLREEWCLCNECEIRGGHEETPLPERRSAEPQQGRKTWPSWRGEKRTTVVNRTRK